MIDGARFEDISKFQQFYDRFAGNSTDMKPVPYAVYAPFDRFMSIVWPDMGVVYSQNLGGFGITTSTLVHGYEVEYSFMGTPM